MNGLHTFRTAHRCCTPGSCKVEINGDYHLWRKILSTIPRTDALRSKRQSTSESDKSTRLRDRVLSIRAPSFETWNATALPPLSRRATKIASNLYDDEVIVAPPDTVPSHVDWTSRRRVGQGARPRRLCWDAFRATLPPANRGGRAVAGWR